MSHHIQPAATSPSFDLLIIPSRSRGGVGRGEGQVSTVSLFSSLFSLHMATRHSSSSRQGQDPSFHQIWSVAYQATPKSHGRHPMNNRCILTGICWPGDHCSQGMAWPPPSPLFFPPSVFVCVCVCMCPETAGRGHGSQHAGSSSLDF